MTSTQLQVKLTELLALPAETEWVEFKHNNSNPHEIGEYLSALSNSTAHPRKPRGFIVWGIKDGTRAVKGTTFEPHRQKGAGNEDLEPWLARGCRHGLTSRSTNSATTAIRSSWWKCKRPITRRSPSRAGNGFNRQLQETLERLPGERADLAAPVCARAGLVGRDLRGGHAERSRSPGDRLRPARVQEEAPQAQSPKWTVGTT